MLDRRSTWHVLGAAVVALLAGALVLVTGHQPGPAPKAASHKSTKARPAARPAPPPPPRPPATLIYNVRAPFGSGDAITLAAAGRAGAHYDVRWGSEINDGVVSFAEPHEFRPGSIVLTHFRHTFRKDVEAFMAQARLNGLTPGLLTDYLK